MTRIGQALLVAGGGLHPRHRAHGRGGNRWSVRDGGIFRIAGVPDAIDPAITIDAGDVLAASCAKLMNYPDKPLPRGRASYRRSPRATRPSPATARPTSSRSGAAFRFNTGEQVTAASFAHAIERILDPRTKSPWVQYVQDIVGAGAVMKGRSTEASGGSLSEEGASDAARVYFTCTPMPR